MSQLPLLPRLLEMTRRIRPRRVPRPLWKKVALMPLCRRTNKLKGNNIACWPQFPSRHGTFLPTHPDSRPRPSPAL